MSGKAILNRKRRAGRKEHGAALVMVAGAMFMVMILAALGIDLGTLYVVRNEAQRAADAAALAGAKMFVTSGFTSGAVSQATITTLATTQAQAIGAQNLVGGQTANIQNTDVTFDFSLPGDPRITVVVQRTTANGNPVPTLFAKLWGHGLSDVKAKATAEAYNPAGHPTGPTFCAACVKPLLFANCDVNNPSPQNGLCPGGTAGYFIDPTTGAIEHPSVIGQTYTFHQESVPSQYGLLDYSSNGGSGLRTDLSSCSITTQFTCGDTVPLLTGNKVGPTAQGVEDMIHANSFGSNQGQDTVDTSNVPFQYVAGANNPMVAAGAVHPGDAISSSDSVVTVPIFDGHDLCPGKSCGPNVTIIGFMEVFIDQIDAGSKGSFPVTATILNITSCKQNAPGTCGNGGDPGTVGGGEGSLLIPVRLIQ